jgi:hypothetical protein
MNRPIRILLQSTIPTSEDDWDIKRFSLLRDYLASLEDETGNKLFEVTARDRQTDSDEDDPVLSTLDESDFDEMWLFAVDIGNSLTPADCAGITAFRQRGGGLLVTRDHQDLGSSICTLGGVGSAHFFHTKNLDPNESRHCRDDSYTTNINWPNYHSGSNGDYQKITASEPIHPLLLNPATSGVIEFFPAHPHEGGVGAPSDAPSSRVIATGTSKVTEKPFNLVVAFERTLDEQHNWVGRAIAESSFHHFLDYNWNTDMGCPSFVEEPPGDGIKREPDALLDIKAYVRNLALWLAPLNNSD